MKFRTKHHVFILRLLLVWVTDLFQVELSVVWQLHVGVRFIYMLSRQRKVSQLKIDQVFSIIVLDVGGRIWCRGVDSLTFLVYIEFEEWRWRLGIRCDSTDLLQVEDRVAERTHIEASHRLRRAGLRSVLSSRWLLHKFLPCENLHSACRLAALLAWEVEYQWLMLVRPRITPTIQHPFVKKRLSNFILVLTREDESGPKAENLIIYSKCDRFLGFRVC